jgi:hypothetical protein
MKHIVKRFHSLIEVMKLNKKRSILLLQILRDFRIVKHIAMHGKTIQESTTPNVLPNGKNAASKQ